MSKAQTLRRLVTERLAAAAEEIFSLVEKTIEEYEQELSRSEKENQRKQQLLDSVLNPRVLLPSAGAQVQTFPGPGPPGPPSPGPGLTHEVTQTQPIKQEPEETGVSQTQEQLRGFGTEEESALSAVMKEEALLLQQMQMEPTEETEAKEISVEMEGDTDSDTSSDTDSDDSSTTDSDDTGSNAGLDDTDRTSFEFSGADIEPAADEEDFNIVQKSSQHHKHKCSVCQRRFKSLPGLLIHSKIHREDYCSLCVRKHGKQMTPEEHMKAHAHTHTDMKSFACPVCNLFFPGMNQLQAHMRVHLRIKTYTCSVCKKVFSKKGALDAHTKIHIGEKPWRCALCQKDFTTSHSLRVHMRSHAPQMLL